MFRSGQRTLPIRSGVVSLAVALAMVAAAAEPRKADEDAAIGWLKGAAHVFSGEDASADELRPLAASLASAQVIGIGEATHGSHQDQAFKASLIKALVQQGHLEYFVVEANRQTGLDLDDYVSGRGGDLPTLLRSPSFFRTWRDEEFADLILWIRAWNLQSDHPVHVIGVDCQDAGVDAKFALRFVAARDPALAAGFDKAFGRLMSTADRPRFAVWVSTAKAPEYQDAEQASRRLEDLFKTHGDAWAAAPGFQEAAYAAKTASEAFYSFELDGGRGDPRSNELAYYGRRDRFMASNMLERLNGHTGAFWAHDQHVLADVPASDGYPTGYTWVGREMRKALGSRYQTVTFAWSRGEFRAQNFSGSYDGDVTHRQPMVPQSFPNDRPGDLGGLLLNVGPERFWVDLRTLPDADWARRFASTPYARGWAGWGVDPATWNKGDGDLTSLRPATDVLVWFKQITPSHMLPGDDF